MYRDGNETSMGPSTPRDFPSLKINPYFSGNSGMSKRFEFLGHGTVKNKFTHKKKPKVSNGRKGSK